VEPYCLSGWRLVLQPFAWQLLFVLGAWLALGGNVTLRPLVRSRPIQAVCIIFLLFALAITLSSRITELRIFFPDWLFDAFNPNDKTNLAPYRVVHLLALVLLVVHFMPIDWPGLKSPALKPLIKCGQQSLEVFCVCVFLSFIAHLVLITTADTVASQIAVGVAGLSAMTTVAYYRSWSKRVEKRTS
jgi:hypothetical protein